MDAKARSLSEILHSGSQLLVPLFQRGYSWRRKDWTQLWDDIVALVEDVASSAGDKKRRHFLGSMVCTVDQAGFSGTSFLLIDGQQRMTTLTILLAAIRDLVRESGDETKSEWIQNTYLVHQYKNGLERYKLLPRTGDREPFLAVIDSKKTHSHQSSPIIRSYRFFLREIRRYLEGAGANLPLDRLVQIVVERLMIVVVTIDDENPFEIFESLNSKGLPLEESDLIRNFLFMQVPASEQDAFDRDIWREFENQFTDTAKELSRQATLFYRCYLMRDGVYSRAKCTFVDFKSAFLLRRISAEEQAKELVRFASFNQQIQTSSVPDSIRVSRLLSDLQRLDVTTVHSLLLNLFDRWDRGAINEDDVVGCLEDISSFVLRRSICGESTRQYGRWFVEAVSCLETSPKKNLQQYLLKRGWPDDETFARELLRFPIYRRESAKCRLMLEKYELSLSKKEKVEFDGLEIEHVMPQTLSKNQHGQKWKAMLGEDWKQVHDAVLHTLGNLTLTGYNRELLNSSFDIKRVELKKSNLSGNRRISANRKWDLNTITVRSAELASVLSQVYQRPTGPAYIPSEESTAVRQSLLADFWSAFSEYFNSEVPDFVAEKAPDPHWCNVPGPRRPFWYGFHVDPDENTLSVITWISGTQREVWLSLLWNSVSWESQQDLCSSLDAEYFWSLRHPQFGIYRPTDNLLNRESWPEFHSWLVRAFREFQTFIEPRILELSKADFLPEVVEQIRAFEDDCDAEEHEIDQELISDSDNSEKYT